MQKRAVKIFWCEEGFATKKPCECTTFHVLQTDIEAGTPVAAICHSEEHVCIWVSEVCN